MKTVHVVLDHVTFKGRVAVFLKSIFPEHDFIIFDKKAGGTGGYLRDPAEDIEYRNIIGSIEQIRFFREMENKYDTIVLHSLFLSPPARLYFGLIDRRLAKKLVWIEWGYDIYDSGSKELKARIYQAINPLIVKVFEKRIPYFIAIHPIDIEQYKRRIKGNARCFFVQYNSSDAEKRKALVDKYDRFKKITMEEKKEAGDPVVFQLGHRANSFLHHKKWIDRLASYIDENFKVVIPLVYGSDAYIKEIEEYSEEKLGDKAMVLREALPYDEYTAFLESVDIFILDAKRQTGLGNIHSFFRMRKKIYLPQASLMSEFFRSKSIEIFDIEEIGTKPYETITEDADMSTAYEFIRQWTLDDSAERWKKIFSEIERNTK